MQHMQTRWKDRLTAEYLPDDGPHWVTAEHFRRGNNLTEPSIHQIELLLTDQAVPF